MSPSPQIDAAKTPPADAQTNPAPLAAPLKTPPSPTPAVRGVPSLPPSSAPPSSVPPSPGSRKEEAAKEDVRKDVAAKSVHLAEAHSRVFDAFSRAFNRQNVQFEKGESKGGTCLARGGSESLKEDQSV